MSISRNNADELLSRIRDIKDYPRQGIIFKDVTPLLKDGGAFKKSVEMLVKSVSGMHFDYVIGIEARGFIFGSALAYRLGKGFIPARKKGKLPYSVISEEYSLEYGSAALDIHTDALEKGSAILIVDDLLATGGTALAAARLVEKAGGVVAGMAFVVELKALDGRSKLHGYNVISLLSC
jgi:adenine phosphoribosyltransferase